MFFQTKLEKALNEWEKKGGNLNDYTQNLSNYQIKNTGDAKAIVKHLKAIHLTEKSVKDELILSTLHSFTNYFQQVKSKRAYNILKKNGLPELIRLFEEGKTHPDGYENDLLFILKILAMYDDGKGTEIVLNAAKNSFEEDSYMWSIIFDQFYERHSNKNRIIDTFADSLPKGRYICISFLDFANYIAINQDLSNHPFNSPTGIEKLSSWLKDSNPDNYSYARSATAALPFISEPSRSELLEISRKHPNMDVKLEAAWASAKIGNENGITFLKEKATDPRYSAVCCEYLKRLGKENTIPSEIKNPDFQAMSEMCSWLAFPTEFGRPPDKIELYDKRFIFWPPTNDKRNVWLFKYTYLPRNASEEIDIGISMVGSVTFALFGEDTADLKPEDVYALHCCWELECNNDKRAPEERSIEAGRKILSQYNPEFK